MLYAVEGNLSLTGINADYRIPLKPHAQFEFVSTLIFEVSKSLGKINQLTNALSINDFAKKHNVPISQLNSLLNDLIKNRGKAIVHGGTTLPEEVHIAVNYLNEILGNSSLYRTDSVEVSVFPLTQNSEFENLISKMNS